MENTSDQKRARFLENKLRKIVREIISEVKTAWNGRLENLDKILSQN